MPLPLPPSILLATASIGLIFARSFPFRTDLFERLIFVGGLLLAVFFLATERVQAFEASEVIREYAVWTNDGLAFSEQWLVLAFGLLTGMQGFAALPKGQKTQGTQWFLLFVLAGLMLVAQSNDFISLGLSVEIVSLGVIAMTRLSDSRSAIKTSQIGTESDLKGLQFTQVSDRSLCQPVHQGQADLKGLQSTQDWVSCLASGGMWLGIAILSNAMATTHFDQLRRIFTETYDPGPDRDAIGAPSRLVLLATGLLVMSLFARMGLVPFQQGIAASLGGHSVRRAGFTIQVGQLTGLIALTRLSGCIFVGVSQALFVPMITVCLATFVLSGIMAIRSLSAAVRSIPRWIASLMLLQSTWMVIGLMILSTELENPGIRWGAFSHQHETLALVVFSSLTSLLACGGLFCTLGYLARPDRDVEFFEDVKGLGQYAPVSSIALTVGMASIIGCPFTAGFWSRWLIVLAGENVHSKSVSNIFTPHDGLRFLILTGLIATLPHVIVVIRLLREMFLELPLARPTPTNGRGPLITGAIAAIATVLIGVAPQLVLNPLTVIHSPRSLQPLNPKPGSGKNSYGLNDRPSSKAVKDVIAGKQGRSE